MNILVANISLLHNGNSLNYSIKGLECGDVTEVVASETNESILKCLVSLCDVKNSGGINRIVALVSDKVLYTEKEYLGETTTAFGYYNKIANQLGITDIVQIPIDNRDISIILNDICSNISINDTVYIDGAGGSRAINNVIQLLTKILKYTGIKNPLNLYADIQNVPNCFISDTRNFDKMTGLADAFNEFMTSGKSSQLRQCLGNTADSIILELVDLMCDFSDKIRLGFVDDIETTVSKLNEAAKKVETETKTLSIESVIIRRFIPIIREKFIGEDGKTDYCRLVNWCLENSLVQQAVTIFTEKIPVYLFDHGILRLENKDLFANYEEECRKNKILPTHWQTNALFSYIMSESVVQNPLVTELIDCLQGKRPSKNLKIQNIINAVNRVKLPIKHGFSDVEIFCIERGFTTKSALVNGLINNKKKCSELLGIITPKDKEQDKFPAIEYIRKNNRFRTTDFSYNISTQNIVNILYGYLYVKTIRNRINHASDAEMFSDPQKMKLKEYDFSVFNLETIKKNIFTALGTITNCGEITEKKTNSQNIDAIANNSINSDGKISSNKTVLKMPKIVGKIDLSQIHKNRK